MIRLTWQGAPWPAHGPTSRVVGRAKQFSNEVVEGVKRSMDIVQQPTLEAIVSFYLGFVVKRVECCTL
jgi:hypothetical protein